MRRKENLYAVHGNVNSYRYYGKQYEVSEGNLHKATTSYFCIYLLKMKSQRGICTPMFIAALFTIVKICKQCVFLLTDKCVKNM